MAPTSEQPGQRPIRALTSPDDPPGGLRSAARFADRHDAGRRLAALLAPLRAENPVVLGIPRGGVPVAAEVARALDAPLDVVVVRKLGAPQNPEYAIGALAEGGVHVLSERAVQALGLSEDTLTELMARCDAELQARLRRYRGERRPIDLHGRTAIVVDDGLATGRSAVAAVRSLRERGAARVILAVPVGAPQSVELLRREADEVVCAEVPEDMWAVGLWYEDFRPTSDEEVSALLARHPAGADPASGGAGGQSREPLVQELRLPLAAELTLKGDLAVPPEARAVVAFAHGSGSGRLSPRNRAVARKLNGARYATLLFDLLSANEELDRRNVFDIPLLAARLEAASSWLAARPEVEHLPLCYFGASTGAAAALTAAAALGERVSAVVSRGGRPDLALDLGSVQAPTLLIVGGADREVLELNRRAQQALRAPSRLAIVAGATHLFEEPGALEQVGDLAIEWLDAHTPSTAHRSALQDGADRLA